MNALGIAARRNVGRRAAERPATRRLSQVDKRRTELWLLAVVVIAGVSVVIAASSFGRALLPEDLRFVTQFASWTTMALLAGLAGAFLLYVLDKERSLRRLRDLVIEERVRSEALSVRLSQLSELSELGKAMNSMLDPGEVLPRILSSALGLLGGDEAAVMLLDDSKRNLEVVSYHGANPQEAELARVPLGVGVAGMIAERRTPMLFRDEDFDGDLTPGYSDRPVRSCMCAPLIRNGDLLGVLTVSEMDGGRDYSEDDLKALTFFAEHAAVALGNATLFGKERAAVSRLEQVDRLKTDFIALVSHDFKTPLTAITGAAQSVAAKADSVEPHELSMLMGIVNRQAQRLLQMVDQLLAASKIETGGMRLTRERLDLRELVQGIVDDLKQARVGWEREIVISTDMESPEVWADRRALEHIAHNLVENALKYSDAGSGVRIDLCDDEGDVLLEFRDRGPGIPTDQIPQIFERFRQIEEGSPGRAGGFGLGLYIVKSLVDAHNGRIEVESEQGVGTTFRVRLPQRRGEGAR